MAILGEVMATPIRRKCRRSQGSFGAHRQTDPDHQQGRSSAAFQTCADSSQSVRERSLRSLYCCSKGVRVSFAVTYPIGFDLRPGRVAVSEAADGILITLDKPVLVSPPGIRFLGHQVPDRGLFIDEEAEVVGLQQRQMDAAIRRGEVIAADQAVTDLCEQRLGASLRAFLSMQAVVTSKAGDRQHGSWHAQPDVVTAADAHRGKSDDISRSIVAAGSKVRVTSIDRRLARFIASSFHWPTNPKLEFSSSKTVQQTGSRSVVANGAPFVQFRWAMQKFDQSEKAGLKEC